MNLRRRRQLGTLVWLAGVVVAAGWVGFDARTDRLPALGFGPPAQLAPIETARLVSLEVEMHQDVVAGQVLALLDDSVIRSELELADAAMLATRQQVDIDAAMAGRRFAESAESGRLMRAQLEIQILEDRAELSALEQRLGIERGLWTDGAGSGYLVMDLEAEIGVVRARLQATEAAVRLAASSADLALARGEQAPLTNEWALVAAARASELVRSRLEQYTLRAPADGVVTAVYTAPGSIVSEGVPVLELRPRVSHRVVAYADVTVASRAAAGTEAVVVRSTGERLAARLRSVGSSPVVLPAALWPFPNEIRYGVAMDFELTEGRVAPGEPLEVWL